MQNYIPPEWEIHMKRMGGQQHVIEHFQRTVVSTYSRHHKSQQALFKDLLSQYQPDLAYTAMLRCPGAKIRLKNDII